MQPDADLPLFAWSPSHEETPAKFVRADGDPRDFTAEWDAFVRDQPEIADYVSRLALYRVAQGATRLSVDSLWTQARDTLHISLNNDLRAACGRWLLARHPELAGVIRIRAARRTK